jgi:hypothetical protein
VGRRATRIENDKWFLKVEADVTNAYNAEAAVNVECVVGGTDAGTATWGNRSTRFSPGVMQVP